MGSLDGLAQRLGALEESLTVVAGELGVSAVPQFKRLDPDAVYEEAVRRAQEAIEPVRNALRKLDSKLAELAQGQSDIARENAATVQRFAANERLSAVDERLAALSARLDTTVLPFDRSDAKLLELNEKIDRLSLRLDTIWERLDAEARAARDAKPSEAHEAVLAQRLSALELRLEKIANAAAANGGPGVAALEARIDERLAAVQASFMAQLERHSAKEAAPHLIDENVIAAEVSRQIALLVKDAAAQAAPSPPLLSDTPLDKTAAINPLVISATERAIVRLTHRLEKLEEWRRAKSGHNKPKSGLMGRLFES